MTLKNYDNKDTNERPQLNEHVDTSLHIETAKEQELIKEIINKEAQINKAKREKLSFEKKIKDIEKSKTWRFSKPIRNIFSFFSRSKKQQTIQYIRELEKKLESTQKELYSTKDTVNELLLDDRKINSYQIAKMIRDLKDEGKIINFIDHILEMKSKHEENYRHALVYSARMFINEPNKYRNFVYSKALSGLTIEEIPEFMIRGGLSDSPIPLKAATSFRASLNMRMRQKQLVDSLPEWLLDDKRTAYEFLEVLGVRIPWTSSETYRAEELPRKKMSVIKPTDGAGSRGVYLIYESDDIIDVKQSKQINSWDTLLNRMKKDILMGWVRQNDWFIEELILENEKEKKPGRDIKFYCFYGKVGLILEITRFPERKHCWWTADGKRIRTGKYEEELYKGDGVTQEELELASSISLKIPAPFVRIDFLRSENGLVFGEFTPKPGNYDEFNDEIDQLLGDFFVDAQGRLLNDLLNEKKFSEFNEVVVK